MREDNFYVKDVYLTDFVNQRNIFTPSQLRDHLKTMCHIVDPEGYVTKWLKDRTCQKEIYRISHGHYRKEREYIKPVENSHNITPT
ncbi:hypothetical protein ACMX2M_23720 [Paenibacillus polymyxa]